MADESKKPQLPSILDTVQYSYSSFVQIAVSIDDVRIAFGDHIPPDGRIHPLFGVTLLPHHAHRLALALLANIQSSPHGQALRHPVMPADLSNLISTPGLKNWKIVKSEEGQVVGLQIFMQDGTEKNVGESELSLEAKKFLGQMAAVENLAKEQPQRQP